MASPNAIADVIDMFIDAPLQFIPRDTVRTGDLWLSVFEDIPDKVFLQAGKDYLKSETEWPSPAKLRALAISVKQHNGASVKHDPFSPIANQTIRTYPWAFRVSGGSHDKGGAWKPVGIDAATAKAHEYTPLEQLMMRDFETWTQQEREWFERETGEEAPCLPLEVCSAE